LDARISVNEWLTIAISPGGADVHEGAEYRK
jgi:hypothetical protein